MYVTSASLRNGRASMDELVARLIERWEHKVQFTPERGSLRNAADVVKELAALPEGEVVEVKPDVMQTALADFYAQKNQR